MITSKNSLFVLLLMIYCFKGIAGDADLEINIDHGSLSNLAYGELGTFSITISNNGPDTAGADAVVDKPVIATAILTPDVNGVFSMSFNQDFSISQSCDFLVSIGEPRPPNPIAFAYQFYFPPIIPGESLTCFGTFRVFFESGTRSIEWVANSLSDTDPNSSDNSHVMVFGVQPIAVPTLSFNMVVVLILVIGLFTKLHFRKAIFND